ncbi:MAG TPA: hypothetical protein VNI54_02565 [Thermoanaerobaculia bacterium]|nr:hypothetical protein [Thermoanaerobaculia bacterium]
MAALLALLLAIVQPASRTDWMRPESFHLAIGMKRADAVGALRAWNPKQGRDPNELVVDYSADKSLTLEFRRERLHAVRFELFMLLPQARAAFEEHRAFLRGRLGEPRKSTKSVLIYDNRLPNVMVVVADDPKSAQGKKGLGVLAVRYYDPARVGPATGRRR